MGVSGGLRLKGIQPGTNLPFPVHRAVRCRSQSAGVLVLAGFWQCPHRGSEVERSRSQVACQQGGNENKRSLTQNIGLFVLVPAQKPKREDCSYSAVLAVDGEKAFFELLLVEVGPEIVAPASAPGERLT